MRFSYRYMNKSSEDGRYHSVMALQDGVQLPTEWVEIDFGSEDTAEDRLRVYPCKLRTDSPVVLLVMEETDTGTVIESAKILEVG